jgi:Ca-activated chloride channel homolog
MRDRSCSKKVNIGKKSYSMRLLGVLLFLLILKPAEGRLHNCAQIPVGQVDQFTIAVKVAMVVLHATVRDSKGILVSGLDKDAFQVFEDGILQQVDSFSHEDIPVTVGLVVDNSGSMGPRQSEVTTAAMAFARSSNPQDQMFVVKFNERVLFGLPDDMLFTDQAAQLSIAMSRVAATGMTALYDAVAAALEHLNQGDLDKKVLIVISDGGDNASTHKLPQIMALAKQSDAIIYTIGLFSESDPDQKPGVLRQLARATGGEAFFPQSVKEVTPTCERIAHDIRNQYTIAYTPANEKKDGTYRLIQVKAVSSDRGRMVVRTRAGYYAPGNSQMLPPRGERGNR